jgi:serine/threonine protein kinase
VSQAQPPDASQVPQQAITAAEAWCGAPLVLTPVTDRRGSAVWQATGPHATAALKTGSGDGAVITAREAAVLDILPGYTVTSGTGSAGAWLVTEWFDGPSTWDLFAPVRDGRGGHGHALTAAVGLCQAVAHIHAMGWVHSDLQPVHGIHTAEGVRLVDLSWAWRDGFEPPDTFRGGIPHFLAPELAASISAGIQPVTPTSAAEVYTLAGTLWKCATGRWPLDYTAVGIDTTRTTAVELRAHIANRHIPLDTAAPWPALQHTLRAVLLADPKDRPTAEELATELTA